MGRCMNLESPQGCRLDETLPTLAAIAAVATAFLASPAHAALKVGTKAPDFKQEGATVIGVTAGKLD